MKIKVLFIIDSLSCGGAEKSLVSMLPLLSQEKYDISLWLISPIGAFLPLVPNHVALIPPVKYNFLERCLLKFSRIIYSILIRVNNIFHIKYHGAELLWKCTGWVTKAPQGDWDVVVAYQQGLPTYLATKKVKARKKIAWINVNIFAAGYDIDYNSNFYNDVDSIVPVSQMLYDLLVEKLPIFKDKYCVIYDILNPRLIHEYSKLYNYSLRTKNSETIIVTTGRLVAQKGYDIAVEAASVLKNLGLKFHWYFVGEGSERTKIEKLIKELDVVEEVTLLGLQTNPYAYMAQADIYVQTSKFEGFGLTIAEAKILGKPIVSTNFDVVYNQLTHEENGLIADMSGESVANNILRLINDSELKESIVHNVSRENNTTYISEVLKIEQLLDSNYGN